MKKIIALCVFFCALTVSAFAQLNVGGYAKTFWIPYRLTIPAEGDALHTTAVQVPWGDLNLSAGINVDGHSDRGGIHLGIGIDAGAEGGDEFTATGGGWVWVAPFDFIPALGMDTFKMYGGNPVDETLQGSIGASDLVAYVLNGSWDGFQQYRMEYREAHYNIFTRINPYAWSNGTAVDGATGAYNAFSPVIKSGAMITWAPITGLYVAAFVAPEIFWPTWVQDGMSANGTPPLPSAGGGDAFFNDYYNAADVYRNVQAAVGYDIPGVGLARVQYLGMRHVIEAALQLKYLRDIKLDIGVKIPFEGTNAKYNGEDGTIESYKKKRDYQVSAAATYRYADFRLKGRIDTAFGGSTSYYVNEPLIHGLDLIAYVVPSYVLDVGEIGLDLGFEYEQGDDILAIAKKENQDMTKDGMKAGAAVWFFRDMGNAKFKAAVATRLPLDWHGTKQDVELFMPLLLEVGF